MSAASTDLSNAVARQAHGVIGTRTSTARAHAADAASERSFHAKLAAFMRDAPPSSSPVKTPAASSPNLSGARASSALARAGVAPAAVAAIRIPAAVTKETQARPPATGSQIMQPASLKATSAPGTVEAGDADQADDANASSGPVGKAAHAGAASSRHAIASRAAAQSADPATGTASSAAVPPNLLPAAAAAAASSPPPPMPGSTATGPASPDAGMELDASASASRGIGSDDAIGVTDPSGQTTPNQEASGDPGASTSSDPATSSTINQAATSTASSRPGTTSSTAPPSPRVSISTPALGPGAAMSAMNWSMLALLQGGSAGAAAQTASPSAAPVPPASGIPGTDGQAATSDAAASTGQQAETAQADVGSAATGRTSADTDGSGQDNGAGTGSLSDGSLSGVEPASAALPVAADHPHARISPDDAPAASATAAAPDASVLTSTSIDASATQPGQASVPTPGSLPGQAVPAGPSSALDMPPSPATATTQTFELASALHGDPVDGAGAPAQVGASLLTLASSADGSSRMAISLHPKELGAVQVQLERSADGTTRIVVAASEPGTLRSLMTSQDQLHAALDAAAIPTTGRHLSFELATSTSPAPGHVGAHPDAAAGSRPDVPTSADMSGFRDTNRQETSQSRDDRTGGFSGRSRDRSDDPGAVGVLGAVSMPSPPSTRRMPSGSINITA